MAKEQREDRIGGVPVREYVEALLAEQNRALAMADNEREIANAALRDEQQRALDQATAERDKAARNLQVELARAIREGDERLREHISNQIQQINAALKSADLLELSRISQVEEKSEAQAVLALARQQANEEAIRKAELAVEKRFEGTNEWRAQSADRERSQQESISLLTATLMPRELAEARIDEVAKTVEARYRDNRAFVSATAQAAEATLKALVDPIQERLVELTRLQHEQQGQKSQVQEQRSAGEYRVAMFGAVGLLIAITLSVLGFTLSRTTSSGNNNPTVTVERVVTTTTPAP